MTTKTSPWIQSKGFDLTFIFGGSLMVLALPAMASWVPSTALLLFWIWVVLFEGPHFAATYARTYWDKSFRGQNTKLLAGSFVFFVFPVVAVWLNQQALYGFFIFSWSLYHNTRQHYGFVSMYSKKSNLNDNEKVLIKWGIYLACYIPMLDFFLNSKLKDNYYSVYSLMPWTESVTLLHVPFAMFMIYLFIKFYKKSLLSLVYMLNSWFFYSFLFLYVLKKEPYFSPTSFSGDSVILVVILSSIFHNIQYLAICWLYGKKNAINQFDSKFWAGAWAFGILVFFPVFFLRGEFSFWIPNSDSSALKNFAYIIYFGIVGHHFYLDQKVWRIGRQVEVQNLLT
ncbi:MAG: hypothetical protein K2P81_11600 [Bacteriovoracaceae bacterium]|nr:hypothetical protein [Bacteriovoracaceae bacterium]